MALDVDQCSSEQEAQDRTPSTDSVDLQDGDEPDGAQVVLPCAVPRG
jgi:hypothetical protein